jgi:hypothetical protein
MCWALGSFWDSATLACSNLHKGDTPIWLDSIKLKGQVSGFFAMRSGWRVGTVFGIPLLLDTSWFLILALVTFLYGSDWQQEGLGAWAWIAGFLMAIALFSSVLLHELGRSPQSRSFCLAALPRSIKNPKHLVRRFRWRSQDLP